MYIIDAVSGWHLCRHIAEYTPSKGQAEMSAILLEEYFYSIMGNMDRIKDIAPERALVLTG